MVEIANSLNSGFVRKCIMEDLGYLNGDGGYYLDVARFFGKKLDYEDLMEKIENDCEFDRWGYA